MPNAKTAEVRMLNNEIHVSLASFHTIYTKADNYYPTINIYRGTSLSTKLVSHVSNALRNNRNTMRF